MKSRVKLHKTKILHVKTFGIAFMHMSIFSIVAITN